jgi:maltodextrin utilization protein YvdJ
MPGVIAFSLLFLLVVIAPAKTTAATDDPLRRGARVSAMLRKLVFVALTALVLIPLSASKARQQLTPYQIGADTGSKTCLPGR